MHIGEGVPFLKMGGGGMVGSGLAGF